MAGDVVYADLELAGRRSAPAQRQRAPAPCPRRHRLLLRLACLGHFILLVLVAALSVQVFRERLRRAAAPSAARPGGDGRPRAAAASCWRASLLKYFCEPERERPSGCSGCQLCPAAWLRHRCACYWVSQRFGTWLEGKEHCEGEGSQLLVLRDRTELEGVQEIVRSSKPVWIGLRSSGRRWKWVDDSALNTDELHFPEASENGCGTAKHGMLENEICDGEHEWVCQKKPFQLTAGTLENQEKCNATV